MTAVLKAMWNDEAGQGFVEYALIIALVSIGLILALTVLKNSIATIFGRIGNTLNANPSTS
jgi:pilus assembly protein Flp/PilA